MSTKIYNVNTADFFTIPGGITLPNGMQQSLGETLTPEAIAAGWRYVVPAVRGERFKESHWAEDGADWREIVTDYTDAELAAKAEAEAAAKEAEAQANAANAAAILQSKCARYGGPVMVLAQQLALVGWKIPCEAEQVVADLLGRVAAGTLTAEQETARNRIADVYGVLQAFGASNRDIADVWAVVQPKEG